MSCVSWLLIELWPSHWNMSKRSFVTVLNPAKEAVMGTLSSSGSINFVGENTLGLRLGDRQVETSQQFSQGLVFSAYQHGQVVMSVVGRGSDTPGLIHFLRSARFQFVQPQLQLIDLPVQLLRLACVLPAVAGPSRYILQRFRNIFTELFQLAAAVWTYFLL